MKTAQHRHRWILTAGPFGNNPGANTYRYACACGACKLEVSDYARQGNGGSRIIREGEHGYRIEDVQIARAATEA
jgi:hypothetical protein